MSTNPPEQPAGGTARPSMTGMMPGQWAGARMPIPGNAEWIWWFVTAIIVAIVAGVSDHLDAGSWVDFLKWTTSAYILSRGIAKASRVLEHKE